MSSTGEIFLFRICSAMATAGRKTRSLVESGARLVSRLASFWFTRSCYPKKPLSGQAFGLREFFGEGQFCSQQATVLDCANGHQKENKKEEAEIEEDCQRESETDKEADEESSYEIGKDFYS